MEKQKKARLDRFGTVASSPTDGGISAVKGDDTADIQAKLAARAQRFALSKNNAPTGSTKEAPKVEEIKKPLDPVAEAKRKVKFGQAELWYMRLEI